jgi:hypothetical protein
MVAVATPARVDPAPVSAMMCRPNALGQEHWTDGVLDLVSPIMLDW